MIKFGILTGTYGYNGTFFVDYVDNKNSKIKDCSVVKIGFSENFSEDFVMEKCNKSGKGFHLKLKEINSKEDAEKLKERAVFVSENDLDSIKTKKYSEKTIGFKIFDSETKREVGTIIEELDMPAGEIWVVDANGNEALFPVVEEFIISTDLKKKRVYYHIIPGLLTANIGKTGDKDDEPED